MKRTILIFILISICFPVVIAQNQLDDQGRKTGHWKVYYPDDGPLRYEGTFSKGRPVGLMKRYSEDGRLAVTLDFYPGSDRCFAKVYHANGVVKAEGVYDRQKKDSVWLYYSPESVLRLKEEYDNGMLSGTSVSYFESGSISRKVHYRNGMKDGAWLQLYENGDTMQVASYSDGMLNGRFTTFNPEGEPEVTGEYVDDQMHGEWKYFGEEGVLKQMLKYDRGTLLNPEDLEESYEKFIRHIEENMNNIPDPAEQ